MRATICPEGQYDGDWVYYDLRTTSEVFLIFTTRLFSFA